ncbi:MAG: hypothetical protein EP329_00735 [Deltaproteobacteria bacterium]|nr:MAG: hypothetical protein EP329_00735 [Deltaproteobacteria bacterium]
MSLRALVTATLRLAGAGDVGNAAERSWGLRELTAGHIDHLVILGGSAPEVIAPLSVRERILWYRLDEHEQSANVTTLTWPAPLELIARACLGRGASPPRDWSTTGLGVAPLRLVGLLAALRPAVQVYFGADGAEAALCAVGGYARGVGFERLEDVEALEEDPAIALLLAFHAREPHRGRHPEEDLDFVCEHSEVFSECEGYRHYVTHMLAWIAGHPLRSLRFAPTDHSELGADLRGLLRDTLARLSDKQLEDLTRSAGVTARDHEGRVTAALNALTSPVWLNFEPPPIPRSAASPRKLNRTKPRTGQRRHTVTRRGLSLDGATDGDPHELLAALASMRARMEARHHVTPLPGTRFVPVGIDLGDLLLFYRIGRGPLGDTFVGALRGHHGVPIPVAVRQLTRPSSGYGAAEADAALSEIGRAKSLQHPNIARILDIRRVAGSDLVVEELVHGLSLAELLSDLETMHEPMPQPLASWVAGRVATALEATSQHRTPLGRPILLADEDARPETVLVSFDGEVKLDVAMALAYSLEAERAAHARVGLSTDASLSAALAQHARAGVLGSEPTAWLAGAVELSLRFVQRNEAYALHLMERSAAHVLRLRMKVHSEAVRIAG